LRRYGHVVKYTMKVLGVLLLILGLLLFSSLYSAVSLRIGSVFASLDP